MKRAILPFILVAASGCAFSGEIVGNPPRTRLITVDQIVCTAEPGFGPAIHEEKTAGGFRKRVIEGRLRRAGFDTDRKDGSLLLRLYFCNTRAGFTMDYRAMIDARVRLLVTPNEAVLEISGVYYAPGLADPHESIWEGMMDHIVKTLVKKVLPAP